MYTDIQGLAVVFNAFLLFKMVYVSHFLRLSLRAQYSYVIGDVLNSHSFLTGGSADITLIYDYCINVLT
jgi:hypothetical protein